MKYANCFKMPFLKVQNQSSVQGLYTEGLLLSNLRSLTPDSEVQSDSPKLTKSVSYDRSHRTMIICVQCSFMFVH